MKKIYQKPTMKAVQLQHHTMLLSGSDNEVHSLGSSGLRYRGGDESYEGDVR